MKETLTSAFNITLCIIGAPVIIPLFILGCAAVGIWFGVSVVLNPFGWRN